MNFNNSHAEAIPIEVEIDLYIAPNGQQAVFCFLVLEDLVDEFEQHDSNPICAWVVEQHNALPSDRTRS